MKKVSKAELSDAYTAFARVLRLDWKQCVGDAEKARCLSHMQRSGRELIAMLERPMRATVPDDLVQRAESLIDQSFQIITSQTIGETDEP